MQLSREFCAMKKIKWDFDTILNDRNVLVDMANNEEDVVKKYQLMSVISFLDNYHFINLSKAKAPKQDLHSRLYYTASERVGYQSAYFLVHQFYNDLLALQPLFDDNKKLLGKVLGSEADFTNKLGLHISNKQAFAAVESFYKSFDSELLEYFYPTFLEKDKQVRFVKDNNTKGADSESDGFCFFVGGLNKNYISVNNEKSPSKAYNLIHEFGHSIANLINPFYCYQERTTFFGEVQSMFPELVAMYENPLGLPEIENLHLLYCNLLANYQNANYLVMHDLIINEWEDNKYRINIPLYFRLKRKYNIDKYELYNSLSKSITDSGEYILSFAVCCELLYIYKQDKAKALKLFKQILNISSYGNELSQVLSIININEHTLDISQDICEKLNLALRKM